MSLEAAFLSIISSLSQGSNDLKKDIHGDTAANEHESRIFSGLKQTQNAKANQRSNNE